MMNRKGLALIASVMLIVAGIAALELTRDRGGGDISVAVGTKNCYEPMWIADQMGYYDLVGVSVKANYVDGGGNASTSVLSGTSDLTLVGADPAIRMLESGKAVLVAAIEIASAGASQDFAYRDGLGIDLNDASTLLNPDGTVRVVCGLDTTTGYYSGYMSYLKSQWDAGNITEGEFELLRTVDDGSNGGGIRHIDFVNQAASLVDGRVQMLCSGNTVAVAAEHDGIVSASAPSGSVVGGCYILASTEAYHSNYGNLVKVLKALDLACQYIQGEDTRQSAAEFCASYYGASGWTAETQLGFFNGYYWDICMSDSIADELGTKARLLGYEPRDYSLLIETGAVRDAHIGIAAYGGLWMYDSRIGTLVPTTEAGS